MNALERKVAIDINQTAVLTCTSHAVPAPTFKWYKGTDLIFQDARVKVGFLTASLQKYLVT